MIEEYKDLVVKQGTDIGIKIFSDTIQNYSTNSFRRVDLKVQLSGAADALAAMKGRSTSTPTR